MISSGFSSFDSAASASVIRTHHPSNAEQAIDMLLNPPADSTIHPAARQPTVQAQQPTQQHNNNNTSSSSQPPRTNIVQPISPGSENDPELAKALQMSLQETTGAAPTKIGNSVISKEEEELNRVLLESYKTNLGMSAGGTWVDPDNPYMRKRSDEY